MNSIIFIEATTGAGYKGIKVAKNKELNVILLTKNRSKYDSCGISKICDVVIETDTDDKNNLLNFILELKSNTNIKIQSVTTFADVYVPQAAYVAEALNLPTIPYESARLCRNKYYMRKEIDKINPKYNPKYFLVENVEDALAKAELLGYPLILKPQDENDSFNVLLITRQDELEIKFNEVSKNTLNRIGQKKESQALLIEEYMSSQEYSVETYSTESEIELIGITKKITSGKERGQFVEIAHVFPSKEHELELYGAVKDVITSMGIKNAIFHTEVKYEKDGIKIVEINPRLAGGGIGSDMIELSTGLSAVSYAVDLSLGINKKWAPTKSKCSVIHKIQADKTGILKSMKVPSEIYNDEKFIKFERFIKDGTSVRQPLLNADLLGYMLMVGDLSDDMLSIAKQYIDSVELYIGVNKHE